MIWGFANWIWNEIKADFESALVLFSLSIDHYSKKNKKKLKEKLEK
jgi:hypothetical protein